MGDIAILGALAVLLILAVAILFEAWRAPIMEDKMETDRNKEGVKNNYPED